MGLQISTPFNREPAALDNYVVYQMSVTLSCGGKAYAEYVNKTQIAKASKPKRNKESC